QEREDRAELHPDLEPVPPPLLDLAMIHRPELVAAERAPRAVRPTGAAQVASRPALHHRALAGFLDGRPRLFFLFELRRPALGKAEVGEAVGASDGLARERIVGFAVAIAGRTVEGQHAS